MLSESGGAGTQHFSSFCATGYLRSMGRYGFLCETRFSRFALTRSPSRGTARRNSFIYARRKKDLHHHQAPAQYVDVLEAHMTSILSLLIVESWFVSLFFLEPMANHNHLLEHWKGTCLTEQRLVDGADDTSFRCGRHVALVFSFHLEVVSG